MRNRRLAWFLAGFLAAIGLNAAASRAYAQAQPSESTRPGDASTATQPGQVDPFAAGSSQDQTTTNPFIDDVLPIDQSRQADGRSDGRSGGGANGRANTQPVVQPDARQATGRQQNNAQRPGVPVTQDDPTDIGEARQRPVAQDGDLNVAVEPQQPQDGIVSFAEPEPVVDGIDALNTDTRTDADIAAFETPPAGFNPLLFQIESVNPVRNNRLTRRLAQLDPFDPIGIRVGSFILFPELELSTTWTSNVLLSPDAVDDVAAVVLPRLRLVSDWNVHALEFSATGDLSEWAENETENNRGYTVESRGRLDVTRRTNLQGIISRQVAQESRTSPDAALVGSRADVTTQQAEGVLNHRLNRLSLQLRGSVGDFAFGATDDGAGNVTSNSDRDYNEYQQSGRATWEFKPTFSVFGEVEINQRRYDRVAAIDGIRRDSNGERYRAGVSFGNEGEILRGEVSLGYGAQTPDSGLLRPVDGLLIDANATWRVNELTSVLFTANTDVTETVVDGVGGAFSRNVGVEVRHAFRRHLIGSAGIAYRTQDSQEGTIDDEEWTTTLGVEYFANRDVVLFGQYEHTDFNGVGELTDFTADEVRVGVRLRR